MVEDYAVNLLRTSIGAIRDFPNAGICVLTHLKVFGDQTNLHCAPKVRF